MDFDYIIVQAGGKGTRLKHLTQNKPKALVPINNRPMIFHLFEKFPDKHFIIIGDYLFDVLEKYLAAFAKVNYTLVNAGGVPGTCGGLITALEHIPTAAPFMLVWCDLILPKDLVLPEITGNYIGISKGFTCRWSYKDGILEEIPSDQQGVAGLFIFKDKKALENVPDRGEFVRWLKTHTIDFAELPLYRTKEFGVLSEYSKLETPICRPFNEIYADGDMIIKRGIDEQGAQLAKREIAWYRKLTDFKFQQMPSIYEYEPLKMKKIQGKNVYEYTSLTHDEKNVILQKIVSALKQIHSYESAPFDEASYYNAYIGKTFDRLKKVYNLVPFATDKTIRINGKDCPNIFFYRDKIENLISHYKPNSFCLLHGDNTFCNILLDNQLDPVFIDPRGYFGYTELYGDEAYDWVKLYYSIVGNYDQFNRKRFSLEIMPDHVNLQIESNHWEDMEESFFSLLEGHVVREQIHLLHAITWLSLTTYAWEDYDSICGAFYKGLLCLEEVL